MQYYYIKIIVQIKIQGCCMIFIHLFLYKISILDYLDPLKTKIKIYNAQSKSPSPVFLSNL